MTKKRRKVIGREVVIDIEGKKIIAKIDTGAYSCSIDMDLAIRLNLMNSCENKKVKNAHGESVRRFVNFNIKIKKTIYNIEATVIDRSKLKYDFIIGRKFLFENNLLVDVSKCVSP